jgi:hypothetical protein
MNQETSYSSFVKQSDTVYNLLPEQRQLFQNRLQSSKQVNNNKLLITEDFTHFWTPHHPPDFIEIVY